MVVTNEREINIMQNRSQISFWRQIALFGAALLVTSLSGNAQTAYKESSSVGARITYNTIEVDGLKIFYREAGGRNSPTVLLLHGFPTSSHMFRNLIPALADRYHVVAPDYPGFGASSMPKEGLRDFWLPLKAYWKDRSAAKADALRESFTLEAVRWQYTHGTRNPNHVSPDNWLIDKALLDRAGNQEIQLQLFYDYRSNLPLYPQWQAYFRKHQPPTLIVWGKNDQIFPAEGAYPYKRDLRNIEFYLLNTGHFALEEESGAIATYIRKFLHRNVQRAMGKKSPSNR
jgi:pimeloyl-ACP methyl ester carboxylesterase